MEHARFKRTGTSSIRVQLSTAWAPLHHLGVVFVYELRNSSIFGVVQLYTIVVIFLGQLGSNRQRAVVAFIGNGHNNLIQRFRCTHARIKYAEFFRFTDLVGVYTRLGVRNVAKVKRNRSISRSSIGLGYLNGCSTGPTRHRNTDRAFGRFQEEYEFIGALPGSTREHLFALKGILARKRARCAIGIHHFRIYRFTSRNSTRKVCSGLSESSTIGFGNRVAPTASKAIHVQRFACLQVVLCLAPSVERQGKRVANLIAASVLHHGAEALGCGIGHINSELERIVCEVVSTVPFGYLQLLGHCKRTGEVDGQLAVVTQVGPNLARANPLRVQHVNGSPGIIRGFCLVKLVKIRQSNSAGLEIGTLAIHPDGALDSLGISAVKAYDLFLLLHGAATRIRHFVVRVLVPIGITRNHLVGALSARFISIDRRVAGEVIVDVVA